MERVITANDPEEILSRMLIIMGIKEDIKTSGLPHRLSLLREKVSSELRLKETQ